MYRALQGHSPHLSSGQLIAALGVTLAAILIAVLRANHLPTPLPASAPHDTFSEERARIHLDELLALGPQRTVGSQANEALAPQLIIKVVEAISKATGARIEVERQWGSGSFTLDFLGGFTSVYGDVQNVLVMLHGTKHTPEEGVLMLSAHYDTPVGTRGASDNTANVANLLEILRALATDRPARSTLFMFTGAEETILQGSHMFARSGHRWVSLVKAFINLEAAGSGGRELMFQASDERLALAWARASPYPHGSIVGQEVFGSGLIPSDTDFRMYVAELKIPGIDMANVDNGHNYHTILDNAGNVEPGAMQRYGSNVLETARTILDDNEFWSRVGPPSDASLFVFFDVLGLFVIVVPPPLVGLMIIIGLVILTAFFRIALFSARPDEAEMDARWDAGKRSFKLLWRSIALPIVSALVAHAILPLSYYARPWFALCLYMTPALYGMVASLVTLQEPVVVRDKEVSLPRKELLAFTFAVAQWALLAMILVIKGKGSFYIAYAWSVIPAGVRLIRALGWREALQSVAGMGETGRNRLEAVEARQAALAGTTEGIIVPLLLTVPLLLVVLRFFVPITGRSGSRVPGDVIVAVVAGLVSYLLFLVPSTLFSLAPPAALKTTRKALFYAWMGALGVVFLLRLAYGKGNASFSAQYPKRIYAVHVDSVRNDGKQESFVWVIDADSSSSDAVMQAVHAKDPFFALNELDVLDCSERDKSMVYCGLPWFLPLKSEIPATVRFPAKASSPETAAQCKLTKTKVENLSEQTRRVHLCLEGNERANIYFRDAAHGGPSKWSLQAELTPTGGHVYILVANGKPQDQTCLWVDVPAKQPLHVAWACYYVEEHITPELNSFLKAIPNWTTPIAFVARWREGTF